MEKIIELFNNPGVAAVFSCFGTLLLTNLFSLISAKSNERKTFFERYFPKRIRAYKDILEQFPDIYKKIGLIKEIQPENRPLKISATYNNLAMLYYKNMVWLDEAAKTILTELLSVLSTTTCQKDKIKLVEFVSDEDFDIIIEIFTKLYALLFKTIETSSGISIINKKMSHLLSPNIFKRLYRKITGYDKEISARIEKYFFPDLPI